MVDLSSLLNKQGAKQIIFNMEMTSVYHLENPQIIFSRGKGYYC